MSCYKSAEANLKNLLKKKGLIDEYLNVLNLGGFRTEVSVWSKHAKEKYGIDERLFYDEQNGTKAVPNKRAFQLIDWKKGVKYPENEWIGNTLIEPIETVEEPKEESYISNQQELYQTQSVSRKRITPEVRDQLLTFLQKVNPDFRVEVIDDLSVNGLVNFS